MQDSWVVARNVAEYYARSLVQEVVLAILFDRVAMHWGSELLGDVLAKQDSWDWLPNWVESRHNNEVTI